jgi:hypothetical protein
MNKYPFIILCVKQNDALHYRVVYQEANFEDGIPDLNENLGLIDTKIAMVSVPEIIVHGVYSLKVYLRGIQCYRDNTTQTNFLDISETIIKLNKLNEKLISIYENQTT